jgi:Tol biopolymer transport system component
MLPLTDDCRPAGEARRLDVPQAWVTSPTWTSDGREIVCSAGELWAGNMRLWKVPVSGSEEPQPLTAVGEYGAQPTISRQGNRLVYANWRYTPDIWRAEISGPGRNSPAVKLIASTYLDMDPQYSPDGSKVVFISDRSGNSEVWMCNSDGSSPVQLTSLEAHSDSPRWFPDGRRIVFDSGKEGHVDIYVIDSESLVPRRLTDGQSDQAQPSVSHDGKWIYFESTRTGRREIWRMPSEGGEPAQVTHEGGMVPFESVDGAVIYYLKQISETVFEVWKVPVSGGDETRVDGPVDAFQFAVVGDGIYFAQVGAHVFVGSRGNSLKFFSFARGTAEKVCDIKYSLENGLSVSPDGRYALMTLTDPEVCDLMLVENFH